jgi:uncharacterized protein (DUF983 family)
MAEKSKPCPGCGSYMEGHTLYNAKVSKMIACSKCGKMLSVRAADIDPVRGVTLSCSYCRAEGRMGHTHVPASTVCQTCGFIRA